MRKLSLLATLIAGCCMTALAQTEIVSPETNADKKTDQYLGVQLNSLVRQVFNFSNSTASPVVSPYLLTYNINSRKTGWGLRAGIGYNYTSTASDDGITATTTKLNDLQLRVGIDRAFTLSGKWTAGAGIDLLYNFNNDNTTTTVRDFDTTTTVTKNKIPAYGGGPMGWLRYAISQRILIGTEASFYYTTGKQTNTVDVTTTVNNGFGTTTQQTTETVTKPTITNGTFTLPVAFYLIVKF